MRKFITVMALVGATLGVATACGTLASAGVASGKGQPEPSASAVTVTVPASTGAVTTEQVVAVAEQTFPQIQPFGYYAPCGLNGQLTGCPYTERLRARLTTLKETLMRAQNPSDSREITAELVSPDAGIAHVKLFGGREVLDLFVVRSGSTVLVDDEICAGQKSTSIYSAFTAC